jgi:hypothetical protein
LAESDFTNIHPEENLYDAVQMAVKLSNRKKHLRDEGLPKERRQRSKIPQFWDQTNMFPVVDGVE